MVGRIHVTGRISQKVGPNDEPVKAFKMIITCHLHACLRTRLTPRRNNRKEHGKQHGCVNVVLNEEGCTDALY